MIAPSPGGEPPGLTRSATAIDWIAQAEARLRSSIAMYRHELDGADLSLCEAFSGAPPHLARPGNVAAWNVRIKAGDLTVRPGIDESCAVQIRGDYQTILPVAQRQIRSIARTPLSIAWCPISPISRTTSTI